MYNSLVKKRFVWVLTVLFLCSNLLIAANGWVASPSGVGPIRVGMSLSQLNRVLNESFSKPMDKEYQGCFYVRPKRNHGIDVMIKDGRVARIDVSRPGLFTAEGLQVGDSESTVKKKYGVKLEIEPRAYTDGHYLTIKAGQFGIRYVSHGKKIEEYYVGRYGVIQYIEGCE